MPGEATLVDQSINRRGLDINEIVAAHSAARQNLQRIGKVQIGVMQHDEARTTLVIEALIAGVDPRFIEACNTT